MANTIKKYSLTNCTANISDSSVEKNTDIILTANDGYYFKNLPSYYLYTNKNNKYYFEKINDFKCFNTLSEFSEATLIIEGKAISAIEIIYDLIHCSNNGVDYAIPSNSLEIILTASEGYIFKDAPYCIDSNYSDTDKIYFDKISDYEYRLTFSADYLSENNTLHIDGNSYQYFTYPIYVYGATVEDVDDFDESEINDNINYGFIKVYKPSVEELQIIANGTFLDVSNIHNVTYEDVSQFIYSLRKVYFKIPEYEKDNVTLGIYNTGIQSEVIKDEIINANCGNVNVDEIYNNVFDYDGFTTAKIYLPFIGFRTIDINNIMNSKVYLYYRLNIITGKIVTILKTDKRGKIYTFDGQGGFDILYTLNQYTSFVNKSANYDVQYMAGLTPYLQLFTKNPYNTELNPYGYKVYEWKKLSSVDGYIECDEIKFMPIHDNIHYDEMQEIKRLCKEGIFL